MPKADRQPELWVPIGMKEPAVFEVPRPELSEVPAVSAVHMREQVPVRVRVQVQAEVLLQ